MYVGRDFSPADPDEVEVYAFDFVKDINAGEDIDSATFTLTVIEGTDASVNSRLAGGSSVTGTVCSQRLQDLQPGVRYLLRCIAFTSNGNEVSLYSHILCKEMV